tara:strand:- start:238 stop:1113 length:876 start_codon:yes stop_codon:yes gene_type:complete
MIVPNQSNLKVHFAGCENQPQFKIIQETNVKYNLYTAFPFIDKKIYGKTTFPIMPCGLNHQDIPKHIQQNMKHSIQDSGLFSLMFGSKKGTINKNDIEKWYNSLVEHTVTSGFTGSCVEVDCQKLFGVELAWEYRNKLKNDLKNRIINVFHKEDEKKGLDRLIEFSDYIAISVPELRFLGKKKSVIPIANYIKNKKPEIDIHLLGCTENKILQQLQFCSSADSTSWTSGRRYGYVAGHKVSNIKIEKFIEYVGKEKFNRMTKWNNEQNASITYLDIENCLRKYNYHAGPQN